MTTPRKRAPDERGGDRHRRMPISLRPPEDVSAWLDAYTAATGEARNAVIVQAIREYAARHSA